MLTLAHIQGGGAKAIARGEASLSEFGLATLARDATASLDAAKAMRVIGFSSNRECGEKRSFTQGSGCEGNFVFERLDAASAAPTGGGAAKGRGRPRRGGGRGGGRGGRAVGR